MSLSPGVRLGPYAITAAIGAGGMGEVWRATDTRLKREVAIKVLPAAFTEDKERLARFEREAQLLAQLNHSNIAHVYGFESATLDDASSVHFLAMELVEGEDLAERLKGGAIPVDEAIPIAKQIAEALEEAHEHGIVHRDLKPANIKVTPEGKVKVLDFGLAKAYSGESGEGSMSELSHSPTMTRQGTEAGLILGTAAYMSPEQARGKAVDKRTDVWAFGALVYEVLTGQKLFQGETVSDVLAAVLTREPSWSGLPAATPPHVRRLLSRCLERDPKLRLRDVGEARIALSGAFSPEEPAATGVPTLSHRLLRALPWALALALGAAALAHRLARPSGPAALAKVSFAFETLDALMPTAHVSPDGSVIAFNQGSLLSRSAIFLRPLASLEAKPLPGGERGGLTYFWSPDGRELALGKTSDGAPPSLVAVEVTSGATRTIAELSGFGSLRGGAWGRDGTILLSIRGTIFRVPATGGVPLALVEPKPESTSWHGFPHWLPDGRRFAFTSETREAGENVPVIQVADLANPAAARVILKGAMLAGVTRDRIVYGNSAGELKATAVDPASFEPRGAPSLLAQQVGNDTRAGFVAASLSETGVLAYRLTSDPLSEFVWMDRSGRRLARLGELGPWHNFDLSTDGTRVIAARRRRGASSSLFLLDAARGVTSPALDSSDFASDPTWSPDGTRLAYRVRDTMVVRPTQGGAETVLRKDSAYPDSWSRDGRFLAYGGARLGRYDLFALEVDAPEKEPLLLATGTPAADEPRFSPDGRWVAYHANSAGGRDEVSVIPFPPTGERWQISADGGVQPRFGPKGDEVFYLDRAGRLMSVRLPGGDPRRAGVPQPLFETRLQPSNIFDQLAVAPDRFLLRMPVGDDPGVPVHVIVGWDR